MVKATKAGEIGREVIKYLGDAYSLMLTPRK
jgi:hypothetical protein